jgi:hypothetical protein
MFVEDIEVVEHDLQRVVDPVGQADRQLTQGGQLVAAADVAQILDKADRTDLIALAF